MTNPKIKLGHAVKDDQGVLHGRIGGLGIGSTDFISEEVKAADGSSYHRLIADPLKNPYEIGAAFPKEKDDMSYFSVSIDSPLLAAPINAALFPDKNKENSFNLVWNRQEATLAVTPRRYVSPNSPQI